MKDLDKLTPVEMKAMLERILQIATMHTYEAPEECTKMERIKIQFMDNDHDYEYLLDYEPGEYCRITRHNAEVDQLIKSANQ